MAEEATAIESKQGAELAQQVAGPTDAHARQPQAQRMDADGRPHKSLNDLIRESGNQQALEAKKSIDDMRKERSTLIVQIKRVRSRLEYKEAEFKAISSFLEAEKAKYDPKKSGGLKRLKNRLEFKLSTEAKMPLAEEKEIVRHINEINAQLDDYYKVVRLERKVGFVKGDIEQYTKDLNSLDAKISELDTKLDDKYRNLKHILGVDAQRVAKARPKKKITPVQLQEINLEDIAVIKKKEPKVKQ